MNRQRIILHLDLDYFFAQAEERRNPTLSGRPIVVCVYSDQERERGAVSTANYAARSFGVHSGMAIFEAKKKLKDKNAVFLPVDFELYLPISAGIGKIVSSRGSIMEQASIDEFYLDITKETSGDYHKAKEIAEDIKQEILKQYNLTCSIGIGPNKLIAKIASNFKKPNGLTIITPQEVQSFLDPLKVDIIIGVGKKTRDFLALKRIITIKDLRNANHAMLIEAFGKRGAAWLHNAARGIDESPVISHWQQKQFSRIRTLKENTNNISVIKQAAASLIPEIIENLKHERLACKTIGIQAIDENMQSYSRSRSLSFPTQDKEKIEKIIFELYEELLLEIKAPLRRIGIKVENLESIKGQHKLEEF